MRATPVPDAGPLEVDLLGPVVVRRGERTLSLAPAQRRLAAALAVHRGAGATSSWLAAATGAPEPDGEAARRSLRTAVWRLRSTLGEDLLVAERGRYRLLVEPDSIDLDRFVRLSEQGRSSLAEGRPDDARDQLRAALELWRGPLLADAPIDLPLPPLAAGAEALRRDVVELVAEASLAAGAAADVVDALEEVVAQHPTRERAWGLLVQAHLALDDSGAARRAADRATEALAAVGLEPSAPLRAVLEGLGDLPRPRPPLVPSAALPAWLRAAREAAPLVGRERELVEVRAHLTGCWREDGAGAAGLAVVEGEAGIGKTRLVAELAQEAHDAGRRVWADRADQLDPSPYHGMAAVVRALLAEAPAELAATATAGPLRPLVDSDTPSSARSEDEQADDRSRLFAAVADLAVTVVGDRPTLVVLDDLHWCDRDSVLLLSHVLRAHPHLPLAVVATTRRVDAGVLADPAVRAALPPSTSWIALAGLTADAVASLPAVDRAQQRVVDHLHAQTGGNPLFVHHLVAAGGDGLSDPAPGLTQAVERHLAALDATTRDVLAEASVQGRRFRLDLLTEADARAVATAVDEAERAHLVRPDLDTTYAFAHPVVQAALEAGQPAGVRAERHLRLARSLEEARPEGAGPLYTIARHFEGAGPLVSGDPIVHYATAAAERAEQALDFAFAARAWHLAASRAPTAEATELLLRAATARASSGQMSEAAEEVDRAAEVAESAHDPDLRARVAVAGARLTLRVASVIPPERRARLDRSLLETEPGRLQAEVAMYRALDLASPDSVAARLRETAPDPTTAVRLADRAFWFAGPEDRHDIAALLAELEPEVDRDLRAVATVVRWVDAVATGSGDLERAPAGGFDPDQEGPPAEGYPAWTWWGWAAARALGAGHFDEAPELAHRAHASGHATGAAWPAQRPVVIVFLAMNLTMLNGLRTPMPAPNELPDPVLSSWTENVSLDRVGAVGRAATFGNHDLARTRLHEAVALLDDASCTTQGSNVAQVAGLLNLAHVLGEVEPLAGLADRLRPHTGEHVVARNALYYGAVDLAVGLVDLRHGRLEQARDALERSVDQHRRVGSPVYVAQSLGALAAVLDRLGRPGDRAEAEAAGAESAEIADRLGLSLRPLAFLHDGA